MFEVPYLVGGIVGGPNGAVDTMGLFFYRITFWDTQNSNNIGLGTAVAVLQFILIFVVTSFQLLVIRKKEIQYE